jgi:hypothetical protein
MNFDYSKMSADERQFIRMYCVTLQREYDMLQIIRGLMEPDGLGMACAADAASAAHKLHKLQQDFYKKLRKKNKNLSDKEDLATPEQIAGIFTQSFFKLVDSDTKKALITDKQLPSHDGWSSGHPLDWQQMIKSLKEIHKQQTDDKFSGNSVIINALLKLFAILPHNINSKKWIKEKPLEWEEDYDDDYDEDNDLDYFM